MDGDMARLARRKGCRACCWFNETGTHEDGSRTFGTCQVAPPRTSSYQQWPVVDASAWCSEWLPVAATHAS